MFEEIVRRWEDNALRAVPLSVTMNSHLVLTIAQFRGDANPKTRSCAALEIDDCFAARPLALMQT